MTTHEDDDEFDEDAFDREFEDDDEDDDDDDDAVEDVPVAPSQRELSGLTRAPDLDEEPELRSPDALDDEDDEDEEREDTGRFLV